MREQAGASELTQDLFLLRGSRWARDELVHGKPPGTAILEYYPLSSNQHGRQINCRPHDPGFDRHSALLTALILWLSCRARVIGVVASPREDYAAADVLNKEWTDFLQQRALISPHNSYRTDPVFPLLDWVSGALPINKYHALALINPSESTARCWISAANGQRFRARCWGPTANH